MEAKYPNGGKTEARSPNGGYNVVTKWSLWRVTQIESQDGFDKLKLDHKVEKDATRTG